MVQRGRVWFSESESVELRGSLSNIVFFLSLKTEVLKLKIKYLFEKRYRNFLNVLKRIYEKGHNDFEIFCYL